MGRAMSEKVVGGGRAMRRWEWGWVGVTMGA